MGAVLIHGTFHHLFGCIFGNILIFELNGRILNIGVQRVQHFPRGSIAVLRQLGHRLFGDLHQRRRDLRRDLMQGTGLVRDLLDGHLHSVCRIKGQMAGQHLVHHDTHGVDVAGAVGLVSLGLLGADIMHTAHGFAVEGRIVRPGNARNAEIHHAQLAVVQQHDVLGLDVPVHHPVGVGVFQRLEDLGDEMHRLPAAELAAPLVEVLPQGHAVHIFHHDILQMVADRNVIHLDDVRVVEQRNGLGFIFEAPHQIRIVHTLLPEHLDGHHGALRHRAVVSQHDRLVDVGHAAGTDQLFDQIQAVQLSADQIIHGAPPAAQRPSGVR